MMSRKHPRHIARELALLSLSQISGKQETLEKEELNNLVLAAINTLTTEMQDALETASEEVRRANDRLVSSEMRATTVQSAKAMVQDALELTQTAINRLGYAIDLPKFLQLSTTHEVREYALELIGAVHRRKKEIEENIARGMDKWQVSRLSRIDRDILRIAVAEIFFLDVPKKVAINEAVELAKNYSDEEGYRFINGVLRRVTERVTVSS